MKMVYIANTRIPTEMAHGLQLMKMCEAFAKNGVDLELIVPLKFRISSVGKKDPFDYYKIERIFKIKKIFCLDLTPLNRFLGPISFLIQVLSFSFLLSIYLLFKKTDIIYSRDRFALALISFIKKNTIFEIHKIHKFLFKGVLRRVKKLVVISRGLKEALIKMRVNQGKILIAPDCVDLEDFKIKKTKEECRRELNLPLNKKIVIYTGHLYKWKGVEALALSSKFLNEDTLIVIVGGIKWYLTNFKRFIKKHNLKNIFLTGYQDYSKIPRFLKAADCLVLTGTKTSEISQKHTSPMKMFEYMASNQPIVASDLPSFREILNQNNSILVESDNPESLAEGIKKIISDPVLTKTISDQALKDVQEYNWDNRAKKILSFINL